MPLQNRVAPSGELIATPARGTFMGNRGVLHDERRRIVRHANSNLWIVCLLEFKDRRLEIMRPARYTQLFFLDEAVALAAGHRPCAECRRPAYRGYLDAVGIGGAPELNQRLRESRPAVRPVTPVADLPDGTFVADGADFRLVWRGALHRWTPDGYVDPVAATDAPLPVVTPALSVTALARGYPVSVHPSAE